MLEEFRMRGIPMGEMGTGIMEQMVKGEIKAKDLTYKQVLQVLDAWDARHIVPSHLQKEMMEDGDIVRPVITVEEVISGEYSQEEYDRNYVEMIEKYLKTIM